MIEYIFQRVLVLSLTGTVLTAVLLLIKKITSKIFDSKWHYYTYLAALLVFLIPLSAKLPQEENVTAYESENKAQVFFIPIDSKNEKDVNAEIVISQVEKTTAKSELFGIYLQISYYFPYVWFLGFCSYFLFSLFSHIIFIRKLKKYAVYIDGNTQYNERLRLTIAKSNYISSPVLAGIIFPTLFLPDRDITDEDFRNILSHESVHLKRHDIEIKWLCLLARSVHWFNPFVHILSYIISKECEISCDLQATRNMDRSQITSYCETILSLVTVKDETASMTALGMGSTKKTLERRFKAIMEEKKVSKKTIIISILAVCIVLLGAFTASAIFGGKAENKKETKNTNSDAVIADNEATNTKGNTERTDADKNTSNDYESVVVYKEMQQNTENTVSDVSNEDTTTDYHPIVIYREPNQDEEIATLKVIETEETENVKYELIPVEEAENSTIRVHPITGEKASQEIEISNGFDKESHPAVDYKLEAGTIVTSPIDGTITVAEYVSDKGNHIEIEGNDGTTRVIFAHLDKMYVSKGDKVNAGDTVGTVGSTGMSTGPHLHVEYYENGEAVNPVEVFIAEENGEILAVYSNPEQILD